MNSGDKKHDEPIPAEGATSQSESRDDIPQDPSATDRLLVRARDHWQVVVGVIAIVLGLTTCLATFLGLTSFSELAQCRADLDHCRSSALIEITVVITQEVTREVVITATLPAPTQSAEILPEVPAPTQEASEVFSIAITEIMHVPVSAIGDATEETRNEYIEIYNYGEEEVDLAQFWLSDGDSTTGQPDTIVAWDTRFQGYDFGSDKETSSTTIAPQQFAIVFSPTYIDELNDQPYDDSIPDDCVVLTVEEQADAGDLDVLGDKLGIEGHRTSARLDTVFLYQGTRGRVDSIVSSYGAPLVLSGESPFNIASMVPSGFPYHLAGFGGVSRVAPDAEDTISNWIIVDWGSETPCY